MTNNNSNPAAVEAERRVMAMVRSNLLEMDTAGKIAYLNNLISKRKPDDPQVAHWQEDIAALEQGVDPEDVVWGRYREGGTAG